MLSTLPIYMHKLINRPYTVYKDKKIVETLYLIYSINRKTKLFINVILSFFINTNILNGDNQLFKYNSTKINYLCQ